MPNHPKNDSEDLESQGFEGLSGFCFAHRASALGYPAVLSIRQALLLCSQVVIGVSRTPDRLVRVVEAWAGKDPRLKVVPIDVGDPPPGNGGIAWWRHAYEATLEACDHEWVVRLDLDEFFHERDVGLILGAVHLAAARGAVAIRTSFREITADWRLAVEPSPFDQIRIWHKRHATLLADGSQAFPQGQVLDLTRVSCWHLDLLLPAPLRAAKLARSYAVHFPLVHTSGRDPLFKHELLLEQDPGAFDALGWRKPARLVAVGGLAAYPRALRCAPRWLTRRTHPQADLLLAGRTPEAGVTFPLPLPASLPGRGHPGP